MAINKIQDVRVGDIFLGPIGGIVGVGVGIGELIVDGGFHVGTVDVRHAGIVVTAQPGVIYTADHPHGLMDNFELAQAMPGGADIVTLTYATHWTNKCLYVRLPEDYPGQAQNAAMIARLMVEHHVAYSPLSYAAIAAWHYGIHDVKLETWINRRQPSIAGPGPYGSTKPMQLPVEAICSVFVDQAWTLAGKKIMSGVAKQAVTPSALATTLIETDGVILGWPGRRMDT